MQLGSANLEYLGHSGFMIFIPDIGKRIMIDPYVVSGKEKADIILITHSHYDHCSIKDIEKISKPGTIVIIPADAQSKVNRLQGIDMHIIEPGEEFDFGYFKIEAVPAYNTDKKFHPEPEGWLGYLVKIKELIFYHAGDTDKIPEMSRITGYAKNENKLIVLLPVSGKYVMDVHEAFETAKMLNPFLAVPMHYGSGVAGTVEDAKSFVEMCTKGGIRAQILEKWI